MTRERFRSDLCSANRTCEPSVTRDRQTHRLCLSPKTKASGRTPDPRPIRDSDGIPQSDIDNTVILTQNDREGTERILRAHAAEIAGVIGELQSGAGGLVVLDQDFVETLREITHELGIILIFDETISLRAGRHRRLPILSAHPRSSAKLRAWIASTTNTAHRAKPGWTLLLDDLENESCGGAAPHAVATLELC
ncbi:aminotransferase class III-fold pyridoxal phosphate-dependent enzyme [Microbacterium sp.]|uniref:aminotransferase class III-fold pyridoxal phosphate-dependent enzyme n=1 Tax=Microbacterium sp. TaxID=51671 RepID=UPI003A902870